MSKTTGGSPWHGTVFVFLWTVIQLREVFSGKITNWNQVGGLNMPVTAVTRERGSGTYNVFKDIIMGEEASIDGKALVMTSTGAVLNTVMRDAGAIGYASSNYQADGVKTIEVRDGEKRVFALIRPLMYAVPASPGGLVEDYLAFCTGEEGKRIVEGIHKNSKIKGKQKWLT